MSDGTAITEGSAATQAELWRERARDWAEIAEQAERPWLGPVYELVLERLDVGADMELLDVGCGAGRFLRMAADRGARVSGIDATPELLAIARERVPEAGLCEGDLQYLPFEDASFDIVTGFNSFFYAADVTAALREARRVLRPDGRLALSAFGRSEECESAPIFDFLGSLMPSFGVERDDPAEGEPGVIDGLLQEAGLSTEDAGYLKITEDHPDLDSMRREWMSAGPIRLAIRHSGESAVRAAITDRLRPLVGADGRLRITDEYHYVIAARA